MISTSGARWIKLTAFTAVETESSILKRSLSIINLRRCLPNEPKPSCQASTSFGESLRSVTLAHLPTRKPPHTSLEFLSPSITVLWAAVPRSYCLRAVFSYVEIPVSMTKGLTPYPQLIIERVRMRMAGLVRGPYVSNIHDSLPMARHQFSIATRSHRKLFPVHIQSLSVCKQLSRRRRDSLSGIIQERYRIIFIKRQRLNVPTYHRLFLVSVHSNRVPAL